MVVPHCEIVWSNHSGAGLGCHPTVDHGVAPYSYAKKSKIAQQHLSSKMLGIWIKNLLTTDYKCKLRYFSTTYTFKTQNDGAAIFIVVVKIICPDTRAEFSYINTKLKIMKMYQFKHYIPKDNPCISECMNGVSISGEHYSETLRNKLNLYYI